MTDLGANNSLGFLHHLLLFCRKLHQEGVKVTLPQEIDACRSLEHIDIFAYHDFYHTLKTNLISQPEDIPVFDKIFFSHWSLLKGKQREEHALIKREKTSKDSIAEESSLRRGKEKRGEIIFSERPQDGLREKNESREIPFFSPHEKLAKKDFSAFSDEELERIKKTILLIAQKIRLQKTRRKKADNKAYLFDLRRTIRKNIRHGGEILKFAWKKPKVTKTRLVLLCDVSGSMEVYSRFLVQFFYGLQNSLSGVETFVFSTRLSRIARILRKEGFEKALGK
ncbi:MAG TPA: VWA domain-containing protein, partial [Thermodesulfobacteriota bacterium]|nr:VWA domain-containing protein [Thermodesulfobacteriota bacterium]